MPILLSSRDTQIEERMDDARCDLDKLINTYRQFAAINSLISGWRFLYRTKIKPLCLNKDRSYSLLDIGFGGGDISLNVAKWAATDNIDIRIIAIETDPRAVAFARTLNAPSNVHFEERSSSDLLQREATFDFVISNHLLHHLEASQLESFLGEARQLCKGRVLFNDIERSDWGYLLFNILARPVFHHSYITEDGIASIKRSYTLEELQNAVSPDWKVKQLFPFRLLLSYDAIPNSNG